MDETNNQAEQVVLEQFVVFVLDDEEYAVPILAVTEVVPTMEIMPVPNTPTYILGLANLRGKVLPVLDLEKMFGLAREGAVRPLHILFAESEQKTMFGILVDQVKEVIKIPKSDIKPPPEIVKNGLAAEYVPGVIILEQQTASTPGAAPQERVLLVLDLQKILSDKNMGELRAAQQAASNMSPTANEQ